MYTQGDGPQNNFGGVFQMISPDAMSISSVVLIGIFVCSGVTSVALCFRRKALLLAA